MNAKVMKAKVEPLNLYLGKSNISFFFSAATYCSSVILAIFCLASRLAWPVLPLLLLETFITDLAWMDLSNPLRSSLYSCLTNAPFFPIGCVSPLSELIFFIIGFFKLSCYVRACFVKCCEYSVALFRL